MTIVRRTPLKIEKWFIAHSSALEGKLNVHSPEYILSFSPEDPQNPNFTYFKVDIEKKIINKRGNNVVFYAKSVSEFLVNNHFDIPSINFLFGLIEEAAVEFEKEFNSRIKHTLLKGLTITKPFIHQVVKALEQIISSWKEEYKISLSKPKINWEESFRNLPLIPDSKKWQLHTHSTIEQEIAAKLFQGQPLTNDEEITLFNLVAYYEKLEAELSKFDFTTLSDDDTVTLENYLFYAFNYVVTTTIPVTVHQTYRIVVNENVTGKNEPILDIRYLSYPPKEVVKSRGKYNRANTPNTTLFYSGENINTALREIRPPLHKLVTLGIWRPTDSTIELNLYPISHGLPDAMINEGFASANKSFKNATANKNPLLTQFVENYLKIQGREFTKRTKHHKEFMVSALFSDRILNQKQKEGGNTIDGIKYPSVGNDYLSDNIAMLPEVLDKNFKLHSIFEFIVEEEYYDSKFDQLHPNTIQVARIIKHKQAKHIMSDGKILW